MFGLWAGCGGEVDDVWLSAGCGSEVVGVWLSAWFDEFDTRPGVRLLR